ncbi:ECF-type sigma factor [Undibacterium sp. Ji22W]|uniref:ECF-type sigma factor n=1 Tax=Undibacterium sp. Ji22W TaxID=3413038 RepID=UPI003BF3989D
MNLPLFPAVGSEVEVVYSELKRIAASRLRLERADHTLSATGLVHEAYLKLVQTDLKWENAPHFRAIAARAMRQILVNYALAHRSEKRGGDWIKLTLTGAEPEIEAQVDGAVDILTLDEALKALGELDPRQAEIVELRYFAGLTIEETADAIKLSVATVKREWAVARLFLKRAMSR